MIFTPLRSGYSIELSQDLDDDAVSLLIKNGLETRFPTACATWKARTSENNETVRKRILEEKQRANEGLGNDKSLLEGTLAREVTRRIFEEYPCVLVS